MALWTGPVPVVHSHLATDQVDETAFARHLVQFHRTANDSEIDYHVHWVFPAQRSHLFQLPQFEPLGLQADLGMFCFVSFFSTGPSLGDRFATLETQPQSLLTTCGALHACIHLTEPARLGVWRC